MSDQLQEFFSLKQRYQSSNALIQYHLLENDFAHLAESTSSAALRAFIRTFIEQEREERARRGKELRDQYKRERETYADERMAVMSRWKDGVVQRSTATALIKASAWWLTHSSGNPVRAPGHANRIENLKWGWSIEYGANHFLISRFIRESTPWLIEGFDLIRKGEILNRKYFYQKVRSVVPRCVANYNLDRYDRYEPSGGQLVFGAQAIDLGDASNYVLNAAGITRYCAPNP